jgi:hypothetical protein
MDAENFAEWMHRQGRQVIRTASSYWYAAGPRVYQAFPYHNLICPPEQEIRQLMVKHGIVSLRYSTPLDFPDGRISYHIVLHNPYSLETLKSQARNGVKRGLARCSIEQVSFERLATEGWALQQDTLDRQDRLRSMKQAEWERICRSAEGLPGFEAWAAVARGELAAALIVCRIGSTWNVPYALSHRKFLNDHVNNALFYSVSCNLLARDGVDGIFFTVQSLDAPASVDDFKFRMGLAAIPVRQRVDFHPWLRSLTTRGAHNLLSRWLQRDESNPTVAKAEGMLRFYLDGRRSLCEQSWPECLLPRKEEILSSVGD